MCSPPLFPSSLFLPGFVLKDESFIAVLSVQKFGTLSFANRVLLLQTYLRVSTAWKITRGNHPLPFADFYSATSAQQFAPALTGVRAGVPPSPGSAWTRVIPSAVHARDRMNTCPRSLALWLTMPCVRTHSLKGFFVPERLTIASNFRWRELRGRTGRGLCASLRSRSIG
jgi:hypothetical protein